MTLSILAARQRAFHYRDADGISECLTGLGLALIGSQDFFQAKLAPFGTFARVIPLVGFLVLFSALLLGNKAITEWIKERLIYPRTGYVAPREDEANQEVSGRNFLYIFLIFTYFFAVIFLASRFPAQSRWIWSAAAILLQISVMFISGEYKRDPLHCVLFLVSLLAGLWWWTFSVPSPPF